MDNNNFLKQLLLIGVGTTTIVADKIKEVSDEWVKEGRIDPDQATDFINDLSSKLKGEQENLDFLIQRQIRNVMQDIGVARQSELDELRGRLDRLEHQVRALENRNWRNK
jgi:polyhydroxyalkanoate synthesis regulator phasin